jgi:hypothetical protein
LSSTGRRGRHSLPSAYQYSDCWLSVQVDCEAIGFIVGAGTVPASGGPRLRVLHGIFGTVTIVLGFLTEAGGLITTKARANRKQLRTFHLWMGRLAVVLSLLTVLVGLPQAGIF